MCLKCLISSFRSKGKLKASLPGVGGVIGVGGAIGVEGQGGYQSFIVRVVGSILSRTRVLMRKS